MDQKKWNTQEVQEDFEVICFMAPFIEVIRRRDKVKGTMQFDHNPRVYYDFRANDR